MVSLCGIEKSHYNSRVSLHEALTKNHCDKPLIACFINPAISLAGLKSSCVIRNREKHYYKNEQFFKKPDFQKQKSQLYETLQHPTNNQHKTTLNIFQKLHLTKLLFVRRNSFSLKTIRTKNISIAIKYQIFKSELILRHSICCSFPCRRPFDRTNDSNVFLLFCDVKKPVG